MCKDQYNFICRKFTRAAVQGGASVFLLKLNNIWSSWSIINFQIADRNARLAYDNCMLKLELNGLKEKYFHQKSDENKLKCLATRSDFCHYKQEKEKGKLKNYQESDLNYTNQLKTSKSELSGLTNNIKLNLKCAVKTSVTSLIERNSGNIPKCQQVSNNLRRSSESFEVMRTESAPLLGTSYKNM